MLGLALLNALPGMAQRGYYKDIFMDGGISVSSRTTLPSATALNLTMDYLTCSPHKLNGKSAYNAADSLFQLELLGGNAMDENGILLYPDGQPRFRMIFMNGGGAARHGASLGDAGRENIRTFIRNGGSYVGSCAGAFLTSKGALGKDGNIYHTDCYLGIWPGHTLSTALSDSRTNLILDSKSPLLEYYDFGGDCRVDSVYHNNGCYALPDSAWPKQTEVLLRYDTQGRELKREIDGQAAVWAYKANEHAGRVIACGSHPEGNSSGEKLDLMCAMVRYALDGNGTPQTERRAEERRTEGNDLPHQRPESRLYPDRGQTVPLFYGAGAKRNQGTDSESATFVGIFRLFRVSLCRIRTLLEDGGCRVP